MGRNIQLVSLAFILVLLLSFSTAVYADRGMIPVRPEVSIYEPGQKAVIAWNGKEEIMILSTDVFSSEESLVVELLPLPSKPSRVELASFKAFEEIEEIIWSVGATTYGTRVGLQDKSEVELVFHEKIGAHDIAIVKAEDSVQLASWIAGFLQENEIAQEVSLQNFEYVIEDYMARGFRYYVIDRITAYSTHKSVEPVLYWFNTSFLYYPLTITSPVKGNTKITLFLFTKTPVEDEYPPFSLAGYQTPNGWKPISVWLSNGKLSKIDLRIGELLKDGAWMSVLTYEGRLNMLTEDLMIVEESLASASVPLEMVIALSMIFGAVCTLAIVVVTYLITCSSRSLKFRGKL